MWGLTLLHPERVSKVINLSLPYQERGEVPWIEVDRSAEVLDRSSVVSLQIPHGTTVGVGHRKLRIELDRLGAILDRSLEIAHLPSRIAAVCINRSAAWIEFDRPRKIGYRPIVIFQCIAEDGPTNLI